MKEQRERAKIDPLLMFKTSGEYLEWDENGIPTVDTTGNAISKNKRKKLVKEWENQKEKHEKWLKTQHAALLKQTIQLTVGIAHAQPSSRQH